MSSKIHIFKLLVCVWCNCVDPSIHVSTMPYTCVSRFKHRAEGCDHITPPESECMTTQCRAIQPQAHVINHSGRVGGWPRFYLLQMPKFSVETVRGVLLLLTQFTGKHWKNMKEYAALSSNLHQAPKQCGEPAVEAPWLRRKHVYGFWYQRDLGSNISSATCQQYDFTSISFFSCKGYMR